MADLKYTEAPPAGALVGIEVWGITKDNADNSTTPLSVGKLADAETLNTGELVFPYWIGNVPTYSGGQIKTLTATLNGTTYTMTMTYTDGRVTQRIVTNDQDATTDTQTIEYSNDGQVTSIIGWART